MLILLLIPGFVEASRILNVTTRFEDEADKKVINEILVDTTGISDGTREWITLKQSEDFKIDALEYTYDEFTFFTYSVRMGAKKTVDNYGIYNVDLDGDVYENDGVIYMKLYVSKNPNSHVVTSYVYKPATTSKSTSTDYITRTTNQNDKTTSGNNNNNNNGNTSSNVTGEVSTTTGVIDVEAEKRKEEEEKARKEEEKKKAEKKRFDFYLMVWVILAVVVLVFVLLTIVKAIRANNLK
jgi:hypothetical protein